ncbi:hypothetical protein I8751_23820 [Nostocaceae cyanobacterium CENA357]|uniref:Uncharacterized protein n=1 Tax=Atlanticothrix silvestris CENA357 TaxID=1725252 RepID=A0A8J7L3V8_9CYAN|nr:hypothetical protein [Atlanticothrix silvestris]MBH8555320.1 hypothetical protein [Atlanticothrix silvestris CENA357]
MNNCLMWKKIFIAVSIATFSCSCEPSVTKKVEQAKATGEPQPQPSIIYGDLVIKEQSDYLMIPVNLAVQNQKQDKSWDFSRSYERNNSQLHNIIFYHKQDGVSHLLLNRKAIISSFDLLEVKTTGKAPIRVWLYKILDEDTNKDQKVNNKDAIIGYISDLSGKNLQQITPNNTKIINWVVVPSQNAIFLKIIKDSDNNKKFTAEDKINFIRVNLEKPSMGTEIISEQIEQESKSYILKDQN